MIEWTQGCRLQTWDLRLGRDLTEQVPSQLVPRFAEANIFIPILLILILFIFVPKLKLFCWFCLSVTFNNAKPNLESVTRVTSLVMMTPMAVVIVATKTVVISLITEIMLIGGNRDDVLGESGEGHLDWGGRRGEGALRHCAGTQPWIYHHQSNELSCQRFSKLKSSFSQRSKQLPLFQTYGDTTHTFVERQKFNGLFLPGYKVLSIDT